MRGNETENYIASIYQGQETALMKQVKSRLIADQKAKKSVGVAEGLVLKFFAAQPGVEKIVEIGTLYGYSTLWFLEGLPSNGKIFTLEKDPDHVKQAQKTFESLGNKKNLIDLIVGDAKQTLSELSPRGPFDLVFIDANKSGYLEYYDWAVDNVRSGAYIIIDNAYLFGSVWDDNIDAPKKMREVVRLLNKKIAESDSILSFSIPTVEGLIIIRKK